MKVAAKFVALGALALGFTTAGHAIADDAVDVETAKKLIGAKIKDASLKARANCGGLKDKNGRPDFGPVRMTLLISHEGHTAPIEVYLGTGATAQCVVQYFTFTHPPYKGPDAKLDYGVQFVTPK